MAKRARHNPAIASIQLRRERESRFKCALIPDNAVLLHSKNTQDWTFKPSHSLRLDATEAGRGANNVAQSSSKLRVHIDFARFVRPGDAAFFAMTGVHQLRRALPFCIGLLLAAVPVWAQSSDPADNHQKPLPLKPDLPGLGRNHRLILKDGSYQVVRDYKIVGDRVHYLSQERGDWEEMPVDMVD